MLQVPQMAFERDVFQSLLRTDNYDLTEASVLGAFADYLDENDGQGEGYRRLCLCVQHRALTTAHRVMASPFSGISPVRLAIELAPFPKVLVADGGISPFICGPGSHRAVMQHPRVDKADPFPALLALRVPTELRCPQLWQALRANAFNVAKARGHDLYVFHGLADLVKGLGMAKLNPPE
jgi:hypothetical protein